MVIDSQQLFPKETPEEKWKLWHFTFYCKVDTQKIQNLILIFFLICVIQRFSSPLLVFLLHCSFSNLCPLCRHKTGCESCWTTAHVKLTWTKILHGSFMGICDGRIKLQSCRWKLHSSHLFFKRWTGNFMLKLAFLRFTTSTNTSAQRRRTSTAIICRSLNTFGALPGKENFWYGGLWCQNSFHTLSQNIPTLVSQDNRIWIWVLRAAPSSNLASLLWPAWADQGYKHHLLVDLSKCHMRCLKNICFFRNPKLVFWVRQSMDSFILQPSGLIFTLKSVPHALSPNPIISVGSQRERTRKAWPR